MTVKISATQAQDIFRQTLVFAQKYDCYCLLDGNTPLFGHYPYQPFATTIGIGTKQKFYSFDEIENWLSQNTENQELKLFGFLSYDLKNQIEKLHSQHQDLLNTPDLFFFEPLYTITFQQDSIVIHGEGDLASIYATILEQNKVIDTSISTNNIILQQKFSKEAYIETVQKIQNYIVEGDVYELNFCMEFFAENVQLNPLATFLRLKALSPMPFATFLKAESLYVLGASPERFIKKTGTNIVSQPIKGTIRRGKDAAEDEALKQKLRSSEKEIAENMMIVDLVRNDFARSAKTGTVKVPEIFGIYTFPQVHQMISTVTATVQPETSITTIIKNAFPMGSMTGAPKIRAMEIIEEVERTKRGIFSGSIGCIKSNGDFDLNVVIRSIFYQAASQYLSFQAGSAITYDAVPEQEYEECLLKTLAIRRTLGISS
jgi:para-aminobenzoate synthetase component 1